jgi:hypothetical protein
MRTFRTACLLVLAFPAAASAEATLVSRDVPLRADRSLSSATPRFTMVGLHWQGSGRVSFRTRSLSGTWSAWRPAAPEDEDRPDRGTGEPTAPGWNVGNPYWTGPSDRIEVRTSGAVGRVRAHYVWSPADRLPARSTSLAGSPAIVPRLSWGANESIRRSAPSYAPSLRFAVVHHTAGTNSYTRAQSAAIVRGIQLYHVQGNGWHDLGYNFLVDKYGQVFEGRYGGIDKPVVGAHAEGFNTGSVGVAVLGNYGGLGITQAAADALVKLVAWRLDVAHVDPLTTFSWPSGGSPKFPRGIPVFLRTVAGHRDTGFTSCPGDRLYARLNELAGQVAATGLPKLYTPVVRGRLGGPIRFTGRLSLALPWTVTVTDAIGNKIATGTGLGTAIDWTWDAAAAPAGTYAWAIEAGTGVLPATGTIGGKAGVLSITRIRADPAIVTPNADGESDTTMVSFVLGAPATLTATVVDDKGATVNTLFSQARPAGEQTFVFAGDAVPDGQYTLVVTAQNGGGKQVAARVPVTVDRALGFVESLDRVFSPNGDGRLDTVRFKFILGVAAEVKARILRDGKWVATAFAGPLPAGAQELAWDGRKRLGRVRDGEYEAEISATTALGTVAQRVAFAADTQAPELRLLSLRPLRLRVSEPGRVVLWLNGQRREFERGREGILWLRALDVYRKVRGVAWDPAGNVSRPASWP